ncbi:MAG: PaaI family thioesterase [Rubrivivax sp.]
MSIWFEPEGLPALPFQPPEGTLARHLGMAFVQRDHDALHVRMPVDARTRQPAGLLHGGASVALAETAMSAGAAWTVDRAHFLVVGLEINANHLKGVREGFVMATARPLYRGRSIQVWACDLRDESGALVCTARMTVSVLERQP